MKAKQFLEKITENWRAIVICFVLALFLYLFHQLAIIDKQTFVIPLKVSQEGAVVRVGDIPTSVRITVRSSRNDVPQIHSNGISALINLDYLSESGTYDVPITLSLSEDLLEIDPLEVRVRPEYISVEVEEKASKAVKVVPQFAAEVEHGYEVREFSVSPELVQITGPASIVEKTDSIFADTVSLSSLVKSTKFKVNLQKINKMIVVDEADFYEVFVDVGPAYMERHFSNVQIYCLSLPPQFEIQSVIPRVEFTLGGNMPILEKFQISQKLVVADLSKISASGVYYVPLSIRLPAGISVIGEQLDNIEIIIEEKMVEEE